MPASSATGDIIWRWTDPKTVELSNVPPEPGHDYAAENRRIAEARAPLSVTGKAATDAERNDQIALMQEMMAADSSMWGGAGEAMARSKAASPKQKREWRKQINRFLKSWDESAQDQGIDIDQGIQEMIDSGAVWQEEDGVYTSIPLRSENKRQKMVDAVEGWSERQAAAGRQYDPSAGWYDPNDKQQIWEEAKRYPDLSDEERAADRARRQNASSNP